MSTHTHTERLGVNAVEKMFLSEKWLFREQLVSDWGVDAQVEPPEEDEPSGRLAALQIKSGASYFKKRGDKYVYRGNKRHLSYWTRHSLPVFIVLHNPDNGLNIWQEIERDRVTFSDAGNWSIEILRTNILNAQSLRLIARGISSDIRSYRRYLLTLDYPLMRRVAQRKSHLTVFEYYTKTLNMRGAEFYFGGRQKGDPDAGVGRWLPSSDIHAYMAHFFPWLDYEHAVPLKYPLGDTEGETHVLKIKINDVARAFMRIEAFYEDRSDPKDYEIPFNIDDQMDDDEYGQWAYQIAMEKD